MFEVKGTARLASFNENVTAEGDTIRMLNVFAGGDILAVYVAPDVSPELLDALRKFDYDALPTFECTFGISNRRSGGKAMRLLALGKAQG